jgi:SAM-dependent methyltransferase
LAEPKILSVLKRLQKWFQDKSGIGENRDALALLRLRVDALAALQQQHLPELLTLPWLPPGLDGVSTAIHRADAMLRLPLSASGGSWTRAATEYFAAGRELAKAVKLVAPEAQDLLDFGCGYGRVGRFLALEFPDARRWAFDPKAGAVAFQQEHWGVQPWSGQSLDLILAGSVFTHLRAESARSELLRLTEALKPQGALVATLHDFTEQTTVSKYTEESALPELEGPIDPRDYVTVSFSQRDWAALSPAGWSWSTRPERYGGTQQILVLRRAEA